MHEYYLGLDLAETAGMAFYRQTDKSIFTMEVKGNPVLQFDVIKNMLGSILFTQSHGDTLKVFIEEMTTFRNAKTTRSLIERNGYLKWALWNQYGVTALMINPKHVRGYLGCNTKLNLYDSLFDQMTGTMPYTMNHTDAVGLILFGGKIDTQLPIIVHGKMVGS